MKIIIFIYLFLFLSSATIEEDNNRTDIINISIIYNLPIYDTIKTNESNAGICLDLKDIKINNKFYLYFNSRNGTINKTLAYKLFGDECSKKFMDFVFDPNDSEFSPVNITNDTQNDDTDELNLEYEFTKNNDSKYAFVIYTGYNGSELSITFKSIKSKIVIYIILGVLAGIIVLFIIICFCCYKCCKKRQKIKIESDYQLPFSDTFVE